MGLINYQKRFNVKIPDNIIQQLKSDLIGKRVQITNKKIDVVGICNFIGYNEYLPNWNLCITIDRLPIDNIKLTDIKIIEDEYHRTK